MPTENGIYQTWIRNLKPGDDVAVKYFVGHNLDVHYKLAVVASSDVDGNIILHNGKSFGPDGLVNEIINEMTGMHIVPITSDIYDQVMSKKKKKRLTNRMANTKWSNLSLEQLLAIEKIILGVK
jgi:hypothetical protein